MDRYFQDQPDDRVRRSASSISAVKLAIYGDPALLAAAKTLNQPVLWVSAGLILRYRRAIGTNIVLEAAEMRNLLLSAILVAGLLLPTVAPDAQTANTVTATCKDGTAFSGATRSGACRGHGGVQSWGAAAISTAPTTSARSKSTKPPVAAEAPGQVWVNTASKVYHCPGTRWYGKTKRGDFMSEAQAKAQGARPDHGKACS